MLRQYLIKFKNWYEYRDSREKLLFVLLAWAFFYAFFYYTLFRSIEIKSTLYLAQIKEAKEKIVNWNQQISRLNSMATNPNFKKWAAQRKAMQILQDQYKAILKSTNVTQWQAITKTILMPQKNITIEQIKNLPENVYNPSNASGLTSKVYQQQLVLVITSNYMDTINYLIKLENTLPSLHFDTMRYEVTNYPLAKVSLEFSLFYEKTS